MLRHLFSLTDPMQVGLFDALGQNRLLLRQGQFWLDPKGLAWLRTPLGGVEIALTWVEAWYFDPHARAEMTEQWNNRQQAIQTSSAEKQKERLTATVDGLHLGRHTERLLWYIHAEASIAKSSVLTVADAVLAQSIWGRDRAGWPRHWRGDLLRGLTSLLFLHATPAAEGQTPAFGLATALLTAASDLHGTTGDLCAAHCPAKGNKHHHFRLDIGKGFFGALERFASTDPESGVRTYERPIGGRKSVGPSLWRLGKENRSISVFLPAKIGEPSACNRFTPQQHRLLVALVRETGRAKKRRRTEVAEPEVFSGNKIMAFSGKGMASCRFLEEETAYVGFNGNRRLRGRGYLLASSKGWLARAGYALSDLAVFLVDLANLATPLGLIPVGVGRGNRHSSLDEMRGMTATAAGSSTLQELHLRIYSQADYAERWSTFFQGGEQTPVPRTPSPPADDLATLLATLAEKGISKRQLATGINEDHSFTNKVLRGEKPCPLGFIPRATTWLAHQPKAAAKVTRATKPREWSIDFKATGNSILDVARAFLKQGLAVIPQLPGAKQPCVKWKSYQEVLPAERDLANWFERWPNAGMALVLGPVSGVFALDVDGPEAHETLLQRLGSEPVAPKSLSGSGKPFRYHLFFQCPPLPTRAKGTPWHPQLEFRGKGGIVIIPPSLHKSGKRYAWAPGCSPADLAFPQVPTPILEALKPVKRPTPVLPPAQISQALAGLDASPRTREFLSGRYAEGPRWNDRLFNAACDLHGRGMPLEIAEPLLLAGARPWNQGEEERARRTILSAYSQVREPGQR